MFVLSDYLINIIKAEAPGVRGFRIMLTDVISISL